MVFPNEITMSTSAFVFAALLFFYHGALSQNFDGDLLKIFPDKNLQIAQANINSSGCPTLPHIEYASIFQSVEAPQIEPMNRQPDDPHNHYDLVMGKPAGVLVKLDGKSMAGNRAFAIALYISHENRYYYECFHEPMRGVMTKGEDNSCVFTKSYLQRGGDLKFFPLPMNNSWLRQNGRTLSLTLTLYPRGYENKRRCHKKEYFQIKIIKTQNLELAFTRIDGGTNCYESRNRNTGYDTTFYDVVENLVYSEEVFWNIPAMFPVARVDSYVLRYFLYGENWNYIKGHCNNSPARLRSKEATVGMLSDVAELEYIRARYKYDKLIAVVPESYFVFHRGINHRSSGFIISPLWEEQRFWRGKVGFLGGSWNIAFVHEDAFNKGVIAHELAHTVGQGREFYEGNERCRQFKGKSSTTCKDYKIPFALSTRTDRDGQHWEFLIDKFSIMNGVVACESLKI